MTDRSYRQHCPIARALDAVGERWALLVVRELGLGPLRYGDLLAALPAIGTKILAERLRALAAAGVLERVRLPAPASAEVYALTRRGQELGATLAALAEWGKPLLGEARPDDGLVPSSVALMMCSRAQGGPGARLAMVLDGQAFTLSVNPTGVTARRGESDADADGTIAASVQDGYALLTQTLTVAAALRQRRLRLTGVATAAFLRQTFGFK